jgi:hypothetical protein
MASEKTPEVTPPEPKPNPLSPRFPDEPPPGFGIPEKIGSIPGDRRRTPWWRRLFG